MEQAHPSAELGPFQLVVFVLSVFMLAVLAAELVIPLDEETTRVVAWIDHVVCAVFFADFTVRFRRAESKREFMRWGWVDLLASVPVIDALRWGRVLRILRVLRLIRAARSLRVVLALIFRSRTRGGVASVGLLTFLVLALSSIGILAAEHDAGGTIRTAEDALWWSAATMTTVGYGDVVPVTGAGRLVAAVLMVAGVGLFGALSGVVASFFLGDGFGARRSAPEHDDVLAAVAELRAEVAALRGALAERPSSRPKDEHPSAPPS